MVGCADRQTHVGSDYSRVGLDNQEVEEWRREVVQKYELPQLHVQTGHCGHLCSGHNSNMTS